MNKWFSFDIIIVLSSVILPKGVNTLFDHCFISFSISFFSLKLISTMVSMLHENLIPRLVKSFCVQSNLSLWLNVSPLNFYYRSIQPVSLNHSLKVLTCWHMCLVFS